MDSWPQTTPNPFYFCSYYIYDALSDVFESKLPIKVLVDTFQNKLQILEIYYQENSTISKEFLSELVDFIWDYKSIISLNSNLSIEIQTLTGRWLLEKMAQYYAQFFREDFASTCMVTEPISIMVKHLLTGPYEEDFKINFITQVMNNYEAINSLPPCVGFFKDIYDWLQSFELESNLKTQLEFLYNKTPNKRKLKREPRFLREFAAKIESLTLDNLDHLFFTQLKINYSRFNLYALYLSKAIHFEEHYKEEVSCFNDYLKQEKIDLKLEKNATYSDQKKQHLAAQPILTKLLPSNFTSITLESYGNILKSLKCFLEKNKSTCKSNPISLTEWGIDSEKKDTYTKPKKRKKKRNKKTKTPVKKVETPKVAKTPLKVQCNPIYEIFLGHPELLKNYRIVEQAIRDAFSIKDEEAYHNLKIAQEKNNLILSRAKTIVPNQLILLHALCSKIEIYQLYYSYTKPASHNKIEDLIQYYQTKNNYLDEILIIFKDVEKLLNQYIPVSQKEELQLARVHDFISILYAYLENNLIRLSKEKQYIDNKDNSLKQSIQKINEELNNIAEIKQRAINDGRYYIPENQRTYFWQRRKTALLLELDQLSALVNDSKDLKNLRTDLISKLDTIEQKIKNIDKNNVSTNKPTNKEEGINPNTSSDSKDKPINLSPLENNDNSLELDNQDINSNIENASRKATVKMNLELSLFFKQANVYKLPKKASKSEINSNDIYNIFKRLTLASTLLRKMTQNIISLIEKTKVEDLRNLPLNLSMLIKTFSLLRMNLNTYISDFTHAHQFIFAHHSDFFVKSAEFLIFLQERQKNLESMGADLLGFGNLLKQQQLDQYYYHRLMLALQHMQYVFSELEKLMTRAKQSFQTIQERINQLQYKFVEDGDILEARLSPIGLSELFECILPAKKAMPKKSETVFSLVSVQHTEEQAIKTSSLSKLSILGKAPAPKIDSPRLVENLAKAEFR